MRFAAVAILAVAWLPAGAASETHDPVRVAHDVVDQSNAFRRSQQLPALEVNAKLTRTAQDFAAFMARGDQFGHEADGREPAARARRHGYDYCMVAENIGYPFRSNGFRNVAELAGGFMEGWKASPGHRKNLVDREATETGVGVARSARSGRYYAVQLFGRPASSSISFGVVNESGRRIDYRVGNSKYSLPQRSTRTHEQCAADAVTFEGESEVPRNGDRFTIVEERGGLRIKRQGGRS